MECYVTGMIHDCIKVLGVWIEDLFCINGRISVLYPMYCTGLYTRQPGVYCTRLYTRQPRVYCVQCNVLDCTQGSGVLCSVYCTVQQATWSVLCPVYCTRLYTRQPGVYFFLCNVLDCTQGSLESTVYCTGLYPGSLECTVFCVLYCTVLDWTVPMQPGIYCTPRSEGAMSVRH